MNKYNIYITIVVIFNYLIFNVLAENSYYVISIRRDNKDEEYDKSTEEVQFAIDELVNERMNNIYNIISENKASYIDGNGKQDEKLDELDLFFKKRKRAIESTGNSKIKFKFINKNRPLKSNGGELNLEKKKRDDLNYISIESNLVIHICPVLNYYVVIAYLSEDIIDEVKKIPNVISCVKSAKSKNHNVLKYKKDTESSNSFYDKVKILQETKWKNITVQEHDYDLLLRNTHLSLISQGKFKFDSGVVYDNNYYYPSSAGKGIDIYVIDNGLDTSYSEEDFDTYKGTPDERTIQCDGIFVDGIKHPLSDSKYCKTEDEGTINHGTLVAISAMGKLHGVAKKANLHMLAIDYETYDVLTALDHIKMNGNAKKSVINISSGCDKLEECMDTIIDDKIYELSESGFIIIISAGNSAINSCELFYSRCKGVIPVGAINNSAFDDYGNMESMYEIVDFSNYGECIQIFAPGKVRITDPQTNEVLYSHEGTSFSSPIVAGVAATIMSENPEVTYNYELMKQTLIDLSLKDVLKSIPGGTPNRLLNNGNHSVFGKKRCDDPSKSYQCEGKCCSKDGVCIDPETKELYKELCYIEKGCLSEFGYCTTNKCGKATTNNRKCLEGECCSSEGDCISIEDDKEGYCFLEKGCVAENSDLCLSSDLNNINNYDEKYHQQIINYNCAQGLEPINKNCVFSDKLLEEEVYYSDEELHKEVCENYKNVNCTTFYESPEEFVPVCKQVDGILDDYSDKSHLDQQNFYCAKKNSDEFCITSLDDFEYIYYDGDMTIIKDYCSFKECRETLALLIKAKYEKMKRIHELNGYYTEKKINEFKEIMEFLQSEKCINQENSQEDIPTEDPTENPTVDPTEDPTEKPSETKDKPTETKNKPTETKNKPTETKNKPTETKDKPTQKDDEPKTTSQKADETLMPTTSTATTTHSVPTGADKDKDKDDDDKSNGASSLQIYPKLINCFIIITLILILF